MYKDSLPTKLRHNLVDINQWRKRKIMEGEDEFTSSNRDVKRNRRESEDARKPPLGVDVIPRWKLGQYGHPSSIDYWYSTQCHDRKCKNCRLFPYNSCFRDYVRPVLAKDAPPNSGYCKFNRKVIGRHNVALIMNNIYGKQEVLQVVGKLHEDGDWRKYEMVTTDNRGFHYLMVQLNTAEKNAARKKHKYKSDYGWVIYEYPRNILSL